MLHCNLQTAAALVHTDVLVTGRDVLRRTSILVLVGDHV